MVNPYFTNAEITCRCGCGMLPKPDFMEKVTRLRMKCAFPFPVTSAARCPEYNEKVSKTGRTGPHTTGRAIDIGVSHEKAFMLMQRALEMGFTGLGVSQKGEGRFIHLDDLMGEDGNARPRVWSY
jgi:zinc D-Ala-D-Ala carboxypeptidase